MKYEIGEKQVSTDWYIVEASSKEEALKIFNDVRGNVASIGSTSGWAGLESEEVFAKEIKATSLGNNGESPQPEDCDTEYE